MSSQRQRNTSVFLCLPLHTHSVTTGEKVTQNNFLPKHEKHIVKLCQTQHERVGLLVTHLPTLKKIKKMVAKINEKRFHILLLRCLSIFC